MPLKVKGKTALITGSTAGLGLAMAERLASCGCNVVLNGIEPPATVEEKLDRIRTTFAVEAHFNGADVGDGDAVASMVAEAANRFGGVDILVNNAVARVFGPIDECSPADWDRAIAVNLTSAFHTIRCTLPGMRARNWGRIINMSSIYGLVGAANRASYVTTKTALIGLTRAVALETVNYDITCNAVCPGTARTTYGDQTIQAAMQREGLSEDEAIRRFLAGKQPAGRFIDADSVAALVVFLCGPAGRDISGAALPVDLGWSAS